METVGLEDIKDIPGFRVILKAVLMIQIQQLVSTITLAFSLLKRNWHFFSGDNSVKIILLPSEKQFTLKGN